MEIYASDKNDYIICMHLYRSFIYLKNKTKKRTGQRCKCADMTLECEWELSCTRMLKKVWLFAAGRLLLLLLRSIIRQLVGVRIKRLNTDRTKIILSNFSTSKGERDETFVFKYMLLTACCHTSSKLSV